MKRKSDCPVNYALENFGDKWSLLIIRDLMFMQKRHYNEFFDGDENISTSVLGDKLRLLEENGLISKKADAIKKSRIKYSLTKKGIELLPIMVDLIVWSGSVDKTLSVGKEFIKQAVQNREDLLDQLRKKLIAEHLKQ